MWPCEDLLEAKVPDGAVKSKANVVGCHFAQPSGLASRLPFCLNGGTAEVVIRAGRRAV